MEVTRLEIRQLRRFDSAQMRPAPGLNVITGDNGAGKSSVLEALHLMGYGKSFRGRVRDGLVRSGTDALEVFVEWSELANTGSETEGRLSHHRKAGLRHTGSEWTGRLDGADVSHLGELCAALAVVTFEPGSHALVTGGADGRRRYLDWGLFHVEPRFYPWWRRYARALKQRNALLKARPKDAQLDAWDAELADAGEPLTRFREEYAIELSSRFSALTGSLVPSLGETRIDYVPGWRRDELPLADALLLARERDRQLGFTSVGPHRADWRIAFSGLPGREALSRGQAKLTALAALLAQATHYRDLRGEWPVIALDDLASELDREHQRRVLTLLLFNHAQVFLTGTELPSTLTEMRTDLAVFHVEHGTILPL